MSGKNEGLRKVRIMRFITNEIYMSGFGVSARDYKKIKCLHDSQNLRDYELQSNLGTDCT